MADYQIKYLMMPHREDKNLNGLLFTQQHKYKNALANNTSFISYDPLKYNDFSALISRAKPEYNGKVADLTSGSFRDKLVKNALFEYDRWGKGKIKEGDKSMHDSMFRYWDTVGSEKTAEQRTLALQQNTEASSTANQWSGAFISTMVKEAGGNDFKFSGLHYDFLQQARKNRESDKGNYKGYKPSEVKVEVGDIIALGGHYDGSGNTNGHSDIVVSVNDGYIETVGGNLSNTVGKTKVKIDKAGKILNDKYHMVVKFSY